MMILITGYTLHLNNDDNNRNNKADVDNDNNNINVQTHTQTIYKYDIAAHDTVRICFHLLGGGLVYIVSCTLRIMIIFMCERCYDIVHTKHLTIKNDS